MNEHTSHHNLYDLGTGYSSVSLYWLFINWALMLISFVVFSTCRLGLGLGFGFVVTVIFSMCSVLTRVTSRFFQSWNHAACSTVHSSLHGE